MSISGLYLVLCLAISAPLAVGDKGSQILKIECEPVIPLSGRDVKLTCKFKEWPRELQNRTAEFIPSDVLEGFAVSRDFYLNPVIRKPVLGVSNRSDTYKQDKLLSWKFETLANIKC